MIYSWNFMVFYFNPNVY